MINRLRPTGRPENRAPTGLLPLRVERTPERGGAEHDRRHTTTITINAQSCVGSPPTLPCPKKKNHSG